MTESNINEFGQMRMILILIFSIATVVTVDSTEVTTDENLAGTSTPKTADQQTKIKEDYNNILIINQTLENYSLTWPRDGNPSQFNNGRLYTIYSEARTHAIATAQCREDRQSLWYLRKQDSLKYISTRLKKLQRLKEYVDSEAWIENRSDIPESTTDKEEVTWEPKKPEIHTGCATFDETEEGTYQISVKDCQESKIVVCVEDTTKAVSYEQDVQLVISQAKEKIKEILQLYQQILLPTEQNKQGISSAIQYKKFDINIIVDYLKKQLQSNIEEAQFIGDVINLKQQVSQIATQSQARKQRVKAKTDIEQKLQTISSEATQCHCPPVQAETEYPTEILTYVSSFISLCSLFASIYVIYRKKQPDHETGETEQPNQEAAQPPYNPHHQVNHQVNAIQLPLLRRNRINL